MYTVRWNLNGIQELDYSSPLKAVEMFSKCCDELPEITGKTIEELDVRLLNGNVLITSAVKLLTIEVK